MASTGTLQISVFDGSRQPWRGPEIRLVIRDPFKNSTKKEIIDKTIKKGTNSITVNEVPTDMGQQYIVFLDADKHRSHSVYPVKPEPGGQTPVNIMLIPDKPVPDFSDFSYKKLKGHSPFFHAALSASITEAEFLALAEADQKFGTARMCALLNIEAKLRATTLKETQLAVSFIRRFADIAALEPDRIKVDVAENMPSNVRGLKTFNELSEQLNEMNHKGFPVSFKEKVAFCSLQLSFAKKAANGVLAADIDIDLLTDIGHFGEVIKNKVTKTKTDQFTIYSLLFDQGIRPLYTLKA
jgi:hypothetical protein